MSLATARPCLVMTTSSPFSTRLRSRSKSACVCSNVAVICQLNHFYSRSQFRRESRQCPTSINVELAPAQSAPPKTVGGIKDQAERHPENKPQPSCFRLRNHQ